MISSKSNANKVSQLVLILLHDPELQRETYLFEINRS